MSPLFPIYFLCSAERYAMVPFWQGMREDVIPMGKCVIIAPLYEGEESAWVEHSAEDFVVCADGGYDAAMRYGIQPDLVIGDFDSMPMDHVKDTPLHRLPVHKDDTDMEVCLEEGRKRGYREFYMLGCIGGRLDHTISNLQCLYDCAMRGETAWMADQQNRVTVLLPGEHILHPVPGRHVSLLAFTPEVSGICLKGTEWELENATLTNRDPLGVSNEARQEEIQLKFASGALLLMYSVDRK